MKTFDKIKSWVILSGCILNALESKDTPALVVSVLGAGLWLAVCLQELNE